MDPDIALVTGLFLAAVSAPSLIAALFDMRVPWVGLLVLAISGAFVWYAFDIREGGYTLSEVPHVIYRMIAALRDAMFS